MVKFYDDHEEYCADSKFVRYICAVCTSWYLITNTTNHEMSKLLGMARINQYHWDPEAEGDIVDKVKRHVRTLMHQDDRSVIKCLSRENKPFCNCMQAKKKEARGMDRKELCSGCGILFSRKGMLKCSGCKIVMFCNEDCQTIHWAKHRELCQGFQKVEARFVK